MTEDRQAWLNDRRASIGGSDAPSILGMTSWGSPLSVYQSKRGLVPDTPDNERLAMGRLLEPVIAQRFMADSGMAVITDPHQIQTVLLERDPGLRCHIYDGEIIVRNDRFPFLHASPDGLCWRENDPRVYLWEAKTVEVWWKDEWNEGAPGHYVTQCQHNDLVCGTDGAVIAAWIGLAERFFWGQIGPFDDAAKSAHIEAMADFWTAVQNSHEPQAQAGDTIPEPEQEGVAPFPDDLLDWDERYPDHVAEAKARKELMDKIKATIKQRMSQLNVTTLVLPNGDSWKWGKGGLRRKEAK